MGAAILRHCDAAALVVSGILRVGICALPADERSEHDVHANEHGNGVGTAKLWKFWRARRIGLRRRRRIGWRVWRRRRRRVLVCGWLTRVFFLRRELALIASARNERPCTEKIPHCVALGRARLACGLDSRVLAYVGRRQFPTFLRHCSYPHVRWICS